MATKNIVKVSHKLDPNNLTQSVTEIIITIVPQFARLLAEQTLFPLCPLEALASPTSSITARNQIKDNGRYRVGSCNYLNFECHGLSYLFFFLKG